MANETVIRLDYTPRAWQDQCHRRIKRFSVLVLHRRAGKTRLAIAEIVDRALAAKKTKGGDAPMYGYVAPYLGQAKGIAWETLKRTLAPLPNVIINEGDTQVTLPNSAVVRIFGGDNPKALRGHGFDGVVMDELKDMKPELWYEVIRPALSDRNGWALFLGTPKGINLLSELYNFAGTQDDWFRAIYTVYETDALPPEEIAALKGSMSENEFRREFLCDFGAGGEDQLISIDTAIAATNRNYKEPDYDFAPKVLGVDVARFGDDRSVIFPRQGLVAFPPTVLAGVDNMTLAARIAKSAKHWGADAIFIDGGGGAGVIDRLRQLGHDVIEVQFGGSPIDPVYLNKRAEMWWSMKQWLESGGAIPEGAELRQDLCAPNYEYTSQGKRKLESKDDIKARLLHSPDTGDALALTFAAPVAPAPKYAHPSFAPKSTLLHDYSPLEA